MYSGKVNCVWLSSFWGLSWQYEGGGSYVNFGVWCFCGEVKRDLDSQSLWM